MISLSSIQLVVFPIAGLFNAALALHPVHVIFCVTCYLFFLSVYLHDTQAGTWCMTMVLLKLTRLSAGTPPFWAQACRSRRLPRMKKKGKIKEILFCL